MVPLRVWLPQVSRKNCENAYKRLGKNLTLGSGEFCAGGEKNKDTCTNDSGNPLMRHISDSIYIEGIVSRGPAICGTQGLPGIYTYVPKYIKWIMRNMRP